MSTLQLDFEDDGKPVIDFIDAHEWVECAFEQRTPEWSQDRLGIPTGTGYSKIITTTGKPSTQSDDYMNQLIANIQAGEDVSGYADFFDKNEDIKNGRELEPEARDLRVFNRENRSSI